MAPPGHDPTHYNPPVQPFFSVWAWRRLRSVPLALALASPAAAQMLPAQPVRLADGRIVVSGEASASSAPEDLGFFNYSDYRFSTLRMLRLAVSTEVKASRHLSVLSEVRSQNGHRPEILALYARVRPWVRRPFTIQAGRIPPTFGAFTRRAYSRDNPLVGYPLAYQYLTSLRSDAVPASANELVDMRGRGWLSTFSIGNTAPDRGLPLVSAFNWDTGIQATGGWRTVELTGSVSAGSASEPRFRDNNGGQQVAGRVSWKPVTGLLAGASFSQAPYLARTASDAAGANGRDRQRVYGADVEYARAHWLVRADTVVSTWDIPTPRAPRLTAPVRAVATEIEGRYTVRAGLYVAARVDHLAFSVITTRRGMTGWEAPVTRVETGAGYAVQRNLHLRASVQRNTRDGGRVTHSVLPSVQLLYWF